MLEQARQMNYERSLSEPDTKGAKVGSIPKRIATLMIALNDLINAGDDCDLKVVYEELIQALSTDEEIIKTLDKTVKTLLKELKGAKRRTHTL